MSSSEPSATRVHGVPRREFLGAAAAAGLSASGWSGLAGSLEEAAAGMDPQDDLFVINMLGGFLNPNPNNGLPVGSPFGERAMADAIDSGMRAVNVTVGGFASDTPESFGSTINAVRRWTERVSGRPAALQHVLSAADIDQTREQSKVGVIFGFQNAVIMGDDATRVETFADLGVRIIQLTYNGANQLGHGALVPANGRLTPFGHEVVEALEAADVLVDLSHSGQRTCLDALRAANRPTAITHTGCRALTDLPRNKTDEELRLVAETGGIVGVYFMPFFLVSDGRADVTDVVRHIEHAIDVCGEDHVGIGTDAGTTQIDDMEAHLASTMYDRTRRRTEEMSQVTIPPGVPLVIPDLHGPDQFRRLSRALAQRRHSADRIAKIMGGNALRVMRDVWRG